MANEMVITLSDHKGVSVDGSEVDHGQYIVNCDGVHVGYLPKTENAWMSCIVSMDDATQAELMKAIERKLKGKVKGLAVPPPREEILDGDDDE